jgi:hypothetical protein
MRHRLIPLCCALLLSLGWMAVNAQDCPAVVETALERLQNACAGMRGNQACYGHHTLSAQLTAGLTEFAFNGVGDITPVETIQSLHLSPFNPANDEWGMTLMRIRADIPDSAPDQNVTLLAFGGVSIEPDTSGEFQPMQAFTFSTGSSSSGCSNVTENGLLIQTPEGVGRVTLWINQVKIRIGSTVLFQAEPGGNLTISTFEGSALVEAAGEVQEAVAGTTVRVPLDDALLPIAPPTVPEVFDFTATGLTTAVDITTAFTDGSITQLLPVVDEISPTIIESVDDDAPAVVSSPDQPAASDETTAAPTESPAASPDSDADTPADEPAPTEQPGGFLSGVIKCLKTLCVIPRG